MVHFVVYWFFIRSIGTPTKFEACKNSEEQPSRTLDLGNYKKYKRFIREMLVDFRCFRLFSPFRPAQLEIKAF